MGIRLDAVGDTLGFTTNLPSNTAFTIMADTVMVSDPGSSFGQFLVALLDASNTDAIALMWEHGVSPNGMAIVISDAGVEISTAVFASRPAVGLPFTWYFKCSGTGANLVEAGWRYPNAPWVTATATLGGSIAAVTQALFGAILATYWSDKVVQNLKVWDRALSASELLEESYYDTVRFPSRLNRNVRCGKVGDYYDRGPRKRNMTPGGTLTTQGFTVPRATFPRRLPRAAASGTTYTQDVGGVLSFAGGLAILTSKAVAGGVSFVGTLPRQVLRAVAGSLPLAGALQRMTGKPLAGQLDLAGSIQRTTGKAASGVVATSGAMTRDTRKAVAGTVTFTGDLPRQTQKPVAGGLAFAGALATAAVHVYTQAVGGVLGFAGGLSVRVNKAVAGTVSFVGVAAAHGPEGTRRARSSSRVRSPSRRTRASPAWSAFAGSLSPGAATKAAAGIGRQQRARSRARHGSKLPAYSPRRAA
jgi:hypothetical protein